MSDESSAIGASLGALVLVAALVAIWLWATRGSKTTVADAQSEIEAWGLKLPTKTVVQVDEKAQSTLGYKNRIEMLNALRTEGSQGPPISVTAKNTEGLLSVAESNPTSQVQ